MKRLDLPLLDPLTPSLELLVSDGAESHNPKISLQALIDTGFDDYLTIPKQVAKQLRLPILGQDEVILANSEQYTVDICKGFVFVPAISHLVLPIDIILGDDEVALIGTRFLSKICDKFSIDFKHSHLILEGLPV